MFFLSSQHCFQELRIFKLQTSKSSNFSLFLRKTRISLRKEIQQHIIEKQNIVLNIDGNISESNLKTLQHEIAHLYKTKIGEMLDRIFTELVPSDVHIKLDKLDIALPKIDIADFKNINDLIKHIERHFSAQAKAIIKEKILKASGGRLEKSRDGRLSVSKWNILESFLEDGHYPSWASIRNQPIEQIFEELMNKSPMKVAKMVVTLAKKSRSKLIDRIVYQFRGKYVDRLLSLLYQKHGKAALKLVENIRRRLGQKYQAMRGQKSVNKAIMSAAFEYVLEQVGSGKKLKYSEKELTQYIVEAIQSKYRHVDESDVATDLYGVKSEFSSEYSDLDVLEYFLLHGSIPYWASTESRQSVQELFSRLSIKKLSALQRMIEKHLNDNAFMHRLVLQFTNEQLFALLEPIAEENRVFLEDFLSEYDKSGFDSLLFKLAILEYLISKKGKFSKENITKAIVEKTASYAGKTVTEIYSRLFKDLELRLESEYNVTRSELLRILKELIPDIESASSIREEKTSELKAIETGILKRISAIGKQLEKEKDKKQIALLKAERRNLRESLAELRKEMTESGIAASDSMAAFAEKKKALEKELAGIKAESKEQQAEKIRSIERELKKQEEAFDSLYRKLLRRFERADSAKKRAELKKEFEMALALLLRDRTALLTEIAATEQQLSLPLEDNLKKELAESEKKLRENLRRLEDKITKTEQLTESIRAESEEKKEETVSENSKLDFLIFFLQYGSIPWWAEEYRESSIESIFKGFAETQSEKLRQAFQRVGRNPVVWQRLVNQLSEEVLEQVLISLFPNFGGFAVSMAIMLQKIYEAKILKALENVSLKNFKWNIVAEILFTNTSALNPQNFIKAVVAQTSRNYNISATTLLEYIVNLSNNNPETRLSIFADIAGPVRKDSEILEIEKELLETAFRKRQEEEGLVIPEDKKYEVIAEFVMKGTYAEITYKSGYSNAEGMEKLLRELMTKQPDAIHKLLESALKNPAARRRLALEFSDAIFWEIVLITGPKTMPLLKKYISDLGLALGDSKMAAAKDAVLKYIVQSADKPFVMNDFMNILLKDAAQITQRQIIAIINEWKRKVYQAPSYSSSLILALMQSEMQLIKEQTEKTEDPTEKENLKDQLYYLQMEYQQLSQRIVGVLHREQPMQQGDMDIPEDGGELYHKIEETEKEIETLKSTLVEKPSGEELLKQIMTQKQIAVLEGQLELLRTHEPFTIRQLMEEIGHLESDLKEQEALLAETAMPKLPPLPPEARPEAMEELASEMEESYNALKRKIQNLPSEEREDWIDFAAEMGWEDILKAWDIGEESDEFLKAMPKLSLTELNERWEALEDKSPYLQRRVSGRLKVLIAKALQQLKKDRKEIEKQILNADSEDKANELRASLLAVELSQNDLLNPFFSAPLDNNLRQQLIRIRNYIRQAFQRLRIAADRRKVELAAAQRAQVEEVIQKKKEEKEKLEQSVQALKEELKTGRKPKEAEVKPQQKEKKKKIDKLVDEPLFVRNAGLVILHPYYNRLFTMMNLVEKNKFVSEEAKIKGVHLLQYIATGKTEHPENDLVLNKIICGLPLDTPVPMDIGLTENDLKTAAGLLSGAIANWPRMKTMSPDSLRGTFILREGNIKEESDRWKLNVEKGSFDILLKTLPWAFTFVRLGWMPKFIMVEWPLPGG